MIITIFPGLQTQHMANEEGSKVKNGRDRDEDAEMDVQSHKKREDQI